MKMCMCNITYSDFKWIKCDLIWFLSFWKNKNKIKALHRADCSLSLVCIHPFFVHANVQLQDVLMFQPMSVLSHMNLENQPQSTSLHPQWKFRAVMWKHPPVFVPELCLATFLPEGRPLCPYIFLSDSSRHCQSHFMPSLDLCIWDKASASFRFFTAAIFTPFSCVLLQKQQIRHALYPPHLLSV